MKSTRTRTESGVLVEGNFAEWHERIATMIKTQKLNIGHPVLAQVAKRQLIQETITKYFEARIPEAAYDTHEKLISAIKERAVPFRLMELPAELRIQILELSLDDPESRVGATIDRPPGPVVPIALGHNSDSGLPTPSIAKATRYLRIECLPIFYARVELILGDIEKQKASGEEIVKRVRRLAARIGPDVCRMLKRVTFTAQLYSADSQRTKETQVVVSGT